MGLLSRFQPQPAPAAAAPAARTWRKTDFLAHSAGEDLHFVCTRDGTPFTVPSFAVDFVFGCKRFRPLDEHVAKHAEKHGWGALQHEALRSWLPRMMEAGLLISSQQVLERAATMKGSGGTPPPISAIGFPTGGARTALVERALASFAANFIAHGRFGELLISDGSGTAEQRAEFRALAHSYDGAVGYAGEEEKRRYLAALARRSGCDPAALEFALFDPLATGFACGANRNAILLHSAGRMFCSVDDDVLCQLAAAPPSSARLSLFSTCDPLERRLFADRARTLAAAHFVAQDFLAAHEALLGRDLGAFFDEHFTEADLDLENAGDELLRRLGQGACQVRATFAGHAGDPGMPTAVFYLFYAAENRARLPHDEAEYRALFASRNELVHAANAALGDASVSQGMAMGLDGREFLPPFFPVLHAEDVIFGATLWQCCPRVLAGHVPWAIVHDPAPGKPMHQPGDLDAGRRMVMPEFAHLLRRIVLHRELPDRADASVRTLALGRHLAELAARPPEDFAQTLRECVLGHESEKIEWFTEQLREEEAASDCWRRDVEAYLDHTREALAHDDFDIPFDLKTGRTPEENRAFMQRLFGEFGRLLEQWPAIFAAARELHERGEEPLFTTHFSR